jgi:hypothetical protein
MAASYSGKADARRSALHCLTLSVYGFAPRFCMFERASCIVRSKNEIVPKGGSLHREQVIRNWRRGE